MIINPQKGDRWTREEMILVFNLYFKLPYGQLDHRNKRVKELARIMGRTDNSVAMRLNNFASCDPILVKRGVSSLDAHKKMCQPYWDEFFGNQEALVFEGEKILAEYQETTIEEKYKDIIKDIPTDIKGVERVREIKTRVNQDFFRKMVLVNYNGKCAISDIDLGELLVASHIIPWAKNEKERLNPENGICLSSLYDKAFDCGLISFSNDFHVMFSTRLKSNVGKEYYAKYFEPIYGRQLNMPQRYYPNSQFLEWHRDCIFEKE